MKTGKELQTSAWQRTGVTGLLRHSVSGRYYWRTRINGKQIWDALETAVFSVAKLRVSERRAIVERNRKAVSKAGDGVATMGDLLRIYTAKATGNTQITPATRKRYVELAKMLPKTWKGFEALKPPQVTLEAIQCWRDQISTTGTGYIPPGAKSGANTKGNSPSTINKVLDVLRQVLSIAHGRGMIARNPLRDVERKAVKLSERPKKPRLPGKEEMRALFLEVEAGAKLGGWGKEAADLLRFLAFTGCRLSEAGAVRWQDVDLEGGILHIHGTKTEAAERRIPLNPSSKALLLAILERRKKSATLSRNGEPYIPPADLVLAVREAQVSLTRACATLGLPRLTHHDLRDVFATTCIEAGIDVPTTARWLGHKDGGALLMRVYGHLRDDHSKLQAAKLNF